MNAFNCSNSLITKTTGSINRPEEDFLSKCGLFHGGAGDLKFRTTKPKRGKIIPPSKQKPRRAR